MFALKTVSTENQFIANLHGVHIYIKREDAIDPFVSGNKYRKLKYNIAFAKAKQKQYLVTYGGAFSNHIAAVAKAAQVTNLSSVGIIRGEELGEDFSKTLKNNSTLRFASACGMRFIFISRTMYREKDSEVTQGYIDTQLNKLGINTQEVLYIPEGGTNALAVKGCKEILTKKDEDFDVICTPVGTGGTVAGLIEGALPHQEVLGFSALKGDFLNREIEKYTDKDHWELITQYHFGGYAKYSNELIDFINQFKTAYDIPLDPIYTGKMMYGIFDQVQHKQFSKNTRILAIHTGGLQGITGFNNKLKRAGAPLLM